MAATIASICSHLYHKLISTATSKLHFLSYNFQNQNQNHYLSISMSALLFFFFFLIAFSLSFALSLFFLYKKLHNRPKQQKPQHDAHVDPSVINRSLSKLIDETQINRENSPTHLTHSLLLDLLPSDPDGVRSGQCDDGIDVSRGDSQKLKKKKKRAKKKRLDSDAKSLGGENDGEERDSGVSSLGPGFNSDPGRVKPELVCLYPFTSTGSATQRKIKHHYDQLVKCNETKGLTLAQVGEFANCLIDARKELQHKSEVIKRKFTITKALLFKADRSSIDRLRQQIYKLEAEQKRLEEDAFVYNWLQQQLKMSPAYKKMLEISACMELNANSGEQQTECKDSEFSDISFEELLAQEKKDAFWQKNGKTRLCSS